jgi:hypothetical protein
MLDVYLIDLAGDEFWKAPSIISIEHLIPEDCWIGCDLVMGTLIFFLTIWF